MPREQITAESLPRLLKSLDSTAVADLRARFFNADVSRISKPLQQLQQSSKKGATYLLATVYYLGQTVACDVVRAKKLFVDIAAKDSRAELMLEVIELLEKSNRSACTKRQFTEMTALAHSGDPLAQTLAATMLDFGYGCVADEEFATESFRTRAAEQNVSAALYDLFDVDNVTETVQYLHRAASLGNEAAVDLLLQYPACTTSPVLPLRGTTVAYINADKEEDAAKLGKTGPVAALPGPRFSM